MPSKNDVNEARYPKIRVSAKAKALLADVAAVRGMSVIVLVDELARKAERAARKRAAALLMVGMFGWLAQGCLTAPDAEQVERTEAGQTTGPTEPANQCVYEPYAQTVCGPGLVGLTCNGRIECPLHESVGFRDEPPGTGWTVSAGARYVYCCNYGF